jgi:hypothetical protein
VEELILIRRTCGCMLWAAVGLVFVVAVVAFLLGLR